MAEEDKQKALAICGINLETAVIPRFKQFTNYDRIDVFAAKGYGLDGKDLSVVDGLEHGIQIKSLDNMDSKWDKYAHKLYAKVLPLNEKNYVVSENKIKNSMNRPLMPIILNVGLTPSCNKLLTQLQVRDALSKRGFKVFHVGSRPMDGMLNYIDFPLNLINAKEKEVIEWLHFINTVAKEAQADVILLGIPGGIDAVDQFNTKLLVMTLYRCIHPQITIVNTPMCEEYKNFEFAYNALFTNCGITVDIFNMSNIVVNWDKSDLGKEQFDYYTIPGEIMPKIYTPRDVRWKYYSIYNTIDIEAMVDYIVSAIRS